MCTCFNTKCSRKVSLVLCLWISSSLLQTALITQFKYIKDDVYSAKDPLLNKDLSCHSAMKSKCVISTSFSDVRNALHAGFEWYLYFNLLYMSHGAKESPLWWIIPVLSLCQTEKIQLWRKFVMICILICYPPNTFELCERRCQALKFVFLKGWYVSTVISINLSHCLCSEVVGGWGVIFSCRGLVLVVTVLPTGSHIPMASEGLVLLSVVDRKLLVSWSEKQ